MKTRHYMIILAEMPDTFVRVLLVHKQKIHRNARETRQARARQARRARGPPRGRHGHAQPIQDHSPPTAPKLGFRAFGHFLIILVLPGGHPTFDCAADPCTQNGLSPSSDRPERRVDTWFHRGMSIHHHTIDCRCPGGNPRGPYPNILRLPKKETHS